MLPSCPHCVTIALLKQTTKATKMKIVSNAEFYLVCTGRPKAVRVDGGIELQYFDKNKRLIGKACNINKKITY
jgi:hypothetical protein